jgi:hypothetical protein
MTFEGFKDDVDRRMQIGSGIARVGVGGGVGMPASRIWMLDVEGFRHKDAL